MRKIFLLLVLLLAIIGIGSAQTVQPFTILDQRGYMPSGLFLFIAAVAILALVVSYRWKDEMVGLIAIIASFVMLWTSRAVDYVTGITIDASSNVTIVHTIYHPEILTVVSGILFVLAILNEYLLYLQWKQNDAIQRGG